MSLNTYNESTVTTIHKNGSYYDVYEGTHYIGPYSTMASAWTKATSYLSGSRSWQDDVRLKGNLVAASEITVPEYTMVKGPANVAQGYNGNIFTDEQIGSSLNADEITIRDLNIELDSGSYNTGHAIHMCTRDSSFEHLKMWGAYEECMILESKGGSTTTRVIGTTLKDIWIGRHPTVDRASLTGGLYFKPTGSNGAADIHMQDMYIINSYKYQLLIEYGANYSLTNVHLTGGGDSVTDGLRLSNVFDLSWSGGCVESAKRYGLYLYGGTHQCEFNDILFFDNCWQANNTYADIYGNSAIGIKVNNCKFRDYGGQANNPKYNIQIVGAGDDYWKGLQNYYDADYAVSAPTIDGSGTFVDTESEEYAS